MVFKKLSETEKLEKEIAELKRLKTGLISGAHKMVGEKKFGKAQQAIVTLGIVIDKLEKLLPAVWTPPEQAEIRKVFSQTTVEMYLDWATANDRQYGKYLRLIQKSDQILVELFKIDFKNADNIPTDYILVRISDLEKPDTLQKIKSTDYSKLVPHNGKGGEESEREN